MSLPLPDVPNRIAYDRLQDLLMACGVPIEDLMSFSCTSTLVEAEFYARDEDGHHIINRPFMEYATHRISIPVESMDGGW